VINVIALFTRRLKEEQASIYTVMIVGQKLKWLNQMKKIGKKTREWLKAKPKLIKIYLKKGITRCENCGGTYLLSFHHRPKRSSQEAVHDYKHTRLLDQRCHGFFEYNDEADERLFAKPRGYNPKNKIMTTNKKKLKKVKWQTPHKCVKCRTMGSTLICSKCGNLSLKLGGEKK